MKDVAIIIVTYNSKKYIKECLLSILNKTKDVSLEIIVVDNNSSDNSIEELEKEFQEVTFIKNKTNLGFGAANNIGINNSKSKYIFLLNPDTKFINNAIQICFNFMEAKENKSVWCCGASILDGNLKPSEAYGKFTSSMKVFFEQFRLNKILKNYYYKKFIPSVGFLNNCPVKVPFIIGADMFIRREALDKIGLFDEEFDLNFEEAELSFRAAKNGYGSAVLPAAEIIHYGGKSFQNIEHQWLFHRKNEILFARKCFLPAKYFIIHTIYLLGTFLRLLTSFSEFDFMLMKYLINKKWNELK